MGGIPSGGEGMRAFIAIDISDNVREKLVQAQDRIARTKAAKMKGLMPSHFSYNHKRGMCRTCKGLGYKLIDLQFLPAVKVTCDVCEGHRLNPISLSIQYKGKHIGNILDLSIDQAKEFFSSFSFFSHYFFGYFFYL